MPKFHDEFEALWSVMRGGSSSEYYNLLIAETHEKILCSMRAEKERLDEQCTRLHEELIEVLRLLGRENNVDAPTELVPRAKALESLLSDARSELEDRKRALEERLSNCNQLAASLGLDPIEAPATFSAEDIEPIIVQQRQLEKMARQRTQFYLKMLEPVWGLYERLQVEGEFTSYTDKTVLAQNLQPRTETAIQEEHKRLLKLSRDMQREVEELVAEIRRVNEVLDREIRVTKECTPTNIETLRQTLGSLRAMFMEHLATLYANARISHIEKSAAVGCPPADAEEPTEEAYQRLIASNVALQDILNRRAKLDSLAEELLAIEATEAELREASKNPERLKARGNLLQEECKRRQRVSVRKPKVLKLMRDKLPQWLAEYGSFVYKGRDFAQEMESGVLAAQTAGAGRIQRTSSSATRSGSGPGVPAGRVASTGASARQAATKRAAAADGRTGAGAGRVNPAMTPAMQPISTPTPAPGRSTASALNTQPKRRPFGPVNGGVQKAKPVVRAPVRPRAPVVRAAPVPARAPAPVDLARPTQRPVVRSPVRQALVEMRVPPIQAPAQTSTPAKPKALALPAQVRPQARAPATREIAAAAESTPLREPFYKNQAIEVPLRTPARNLWDLSFDPNFSVESNSTYTNK